MTSKFDFYEIVTINTQNPKRKNLNGQRAAVLAKGQESDEPDALIKYYDIWVYQLEKVFSFHEDELLATGEFDKRENFFSGESIRVSVDPETGEGKIVP